MPEDSTNDRSLLSRLNALKPSNVDLDRVQDSSEAPNDDDGDDDIARRFLGLRRKESGQVDISGGRTKTASDSPNGLGEEEEVESIEDMLKELRATQKKTLAVDDDKRVQILLAQANAALAEEDDENEGKGELKAAGSIGDTKNLSSQTKIDDEDGEEEQSNVDEDAEADELLAQLLDEVQLEGDSTENITSQEPAETDYLSGTNTAFDEQLFPSTPSKEPVAAISTPPDGHELQLPSAPTSVPAKPKPKAALPKYTDEEIETWCEICQADAEVRCLGCDGDLYCLRCWNEGHTGPDVGYEERRHRCVQYSKPGRPEAAAA